MNTITLITCCFASFILIDIIVSLIFRNTTTGKIFLFNCIVLLAVFVFSALTREGFLSGPVYGTLVTAGISVFPLLFGLLIKKHLHLKNISIIPPLSVCAILVPVACAVWPGLTVILPPVLIMGFCIGIVVILLKSPFLPKSISLPMAAAPVVCMTMAGLALYTGKAAWLLSGIGVLFLATSFVYMIRYHRMFVKLSRQLRMAKQLNREMIHMVARLKQKAEQLKKVIHEKELELLQMSKHASLAEITTGIAHELTQPLTGIKGIAQNMIDDINLDEFDNLQAASELLRISSLVDKSSSIIDHIRNFSKKGYMTLQPVDMNRVILDAIDLINLQFRKQNIDIILVLNEDIPAIPGDKISLEQLFINFLLNARDAITEKRKTETDDYNGTITLSTEYTDNHVRIFIKDNGIGIPQDNLKKIWSPFFTTKHRSKSTGVGLSIIMKILKEHRSLISVESVFGEGTTFTISIPVKKELPASAPVYSD